MNVEYRLAKVAPARAATRGADTATLRVGRAVTPDRGRVRMRSALVVAVSRNDRCTEVVASLMITSYHTVIHNVIAQGRPLSASGGPAPSCGIIAR